MNEEKTSVEAIIEKILQKAVNEKASAVRFEVLGDEVIVRFKIGKNPRIAYRFDKSLMSWLTARFCIYSSLPLDTKYVPLKQLKGRFSLDLGGCVRQFEVSIKPVVLEGPVFSNTITVDILS